MATHDYIISNASGAAVRADLNNALAAIATNNSSATEPTTTYAYQWWADTGSSPTVMKLRNAANSAWITLFQLDGEWTVVPFENGTAAAPSIYFKDSGTDTGIYSPGTDQVGISAGGTSRFEVSTSATTSTLPVVHPLGAVGTPSITFTGDLNTGIWSPAADTVAVSTNGTRAITIDSSQRLGIGTTTGVGKLTVFTSTTYTPGNNYNDGCLLVGNGTATTGNLAISYNDTDGAAFTSLIPGTAWKDCSFGGNQLKFSTGGSERARLDSSGRLLVGTSSARSNIREGTDNETPKIQLESATNDYSEAGLSVINNSSSGFAPQLWLGRSASDSIGGNALVSSGRIGSISFNAADGTNFIQGARIQADIDGTSGSGDLPTRLSFSTTSDGASSPTERVRIMSNGDITFGNGITNAATALSNTVGIGFEVNNGAGFFSRNGAASGFFNRKGSDGDVISIIQDGVQEGTIHVSGTTVTLVGAHLSRWSQILGIDPYDKTVRPEILRGTVMSNLDEMCDWIAPDSGDAQANEQLNKTKISDVEGDKNVAGVFQSWDDDDDTWVNDYYLAMTGDFVIRIAAGVTVERGDLLMSAGDGTAKPQTDDALRSCTIAKVTSTHISHTFDDGSYCVPCVLMAC